jgi:predicted dehydrogenase
MNQTTIKVGLASFGMSGKVFHAPLIKSHPGFLLKSVVERSKNESQKVYPEVQVVRSFEELLRDQTIDLVVVNTPDNTHATFAMKALEAGKHVIVEKPFTQTISEGEKLIEFAHKKNLLLSVFQNRRWDGDFLTVKEIISKGLLGRLVEFESHFDRYRNFIQANTWKEEPSSGTGTLYNLGSHMIDQAIVLFGMPEAVYADLRILRTGGKIDDSYDLKLYYPNIKVTLKGCYLAREAGARYMLNGTLGSYVKYGLDPQEDDLKNGISLLNANWGKEPEEKWGLLNTDIDTLHFYGKIETKPGNYMAYYNNIYNAITQNEPLQVKAEEALNVIKIINSAISSSTEKMLVKL